jgi:hypothetical protein
MRPSIFFATMMSLAARRHFQGDGTRMACPLHYACASCGLAHRKQLSYRHIAVGAFESSRTRRCPRITRTSMGLRRHVRNVRVASGLIRRPSTSALHAFRKHEDQGGRCRYSCERTQRLLTSACIVHAVCMCLASATSKTLGCGDGPPTLTTPRQQRPLHPRICWLRPP